MEAEVVKEVFDAIYEPLLDLLCLMALADEFGFEYGEFV